MESCALQFVYKSVLFLDPGQKVQSRALTLVELLLVLSIAGTLAAIAVPVVTNYMQKVRMNEAIARIREMESTIVAFQVQFGAPPNNLGQVGLANQRDPWGNAYRYLRILGVPPGQIQGSWRKDRFLVPINSDFDLYSMGSDGRSSLPLTARTSQDDVVRANNGGFVGLASEF
jgi:general secretion pathway protein G